MDRTLNHQFNNSNLSSIKAIIEILSGSHYCEMNKKGLSME